jgi:hypothetical protein
MPTPNLMVGSEQEPRSMLPFAGAAVAAGGAALVVVAEGSAAAVLVAISVAVGDGADASTVTV